MTGKILARLAILGCLFLSASFLAAQDWPQWRGGNRDAKAVSFKAPATWPAELTKKWKTTVGLGESCPVMVGDKIYSFSRQGKEETTLCLDATTGAEVWKESYLAEPVTGAAAAHPGPRSTPAVGEGKVCTLGVGGVISCIDATSGKMVWRHDTKAKPQFYTSTSPLIVDGQCVVFLGKAGKGALSAIDLASGETKWEWNGEGPPYGSPALMVVDGIKQIVTPTDKSVVGVDLADGKLLWKYAFASKLNSITPIIDGQRVICSGPQGGTVAFTVEKKGDEFTANKLWKQAVAAHQYNTPVLKGGFLYGMTERKNFFCVNATTGDLAWTDSAPRGECGGIVDAGTVLVALTSDTNLIVFEPNDKEFKQVAHYKVADTPPWSYPILSGNRVFVKDRESIALRTID